MRAIPARDKANYDVNITNLKNSMRMVVNPGDTITWFTTDDTVTLIFPTVALFGEINYLILPHSQMSLTIAPTASPGEYPYAIYNHTTNKLEGDGTEPQIIIV